MTHLAWLLLQDALLLLLQVQELLLGRQLLLLVGPQLLLLLLPPVLLLAASLAPGLRAAISVDGMWSPWSTVKVSWDWSTHNTQ